MKRILFSLGALFTLSTLAVLLLMPATPAVAQPSSCPVTLPPASFEIPDGFTPPARGTDHFYYGSPELWVVLSPGPWTGLPLWDIGYRNKIVWYSNTFNRTEQTWKQLPHPEIAISGRRLDGNAPPLIATEGNATFLEEGSAIMSAVNFPTTGCWEITGRLGNTATTFVVEVAE